MAFLQRTMNRGSVSTGYDIDNSLKFEADNTEYLHRTVSSAGNRDIGTISCWVKRTELGGHMYLFTFGNTDNDTGRTYIKFQNTDTLRVGGGSTLWRETNRLFRDTSAWYHVVVAFDTSQSTANDRIKIYINGVQETSFSTTNNPSQNDNLGINFEKQTVGYNSIDNDSPFNGYITEICYQDGTASAASDFGEFDEDTGIWIPKDVSGVASGTNGFYLDFEDSSNMGNDVSGGTDFTENNTAAADQATDTPTNNFATINILHAQTSNSTYSEGATYAVNGQIQGWQPYIPTIAVTSGKWYFETQGGGSDMYLMTGMGDEGDILEWGIDQKYYGRSGSKSVAYYGGTGGNGLIYPAQTNPSPAVGYGSSDIIGCAVDIDNGYVYWSKNGTYINSGVPTSGSSGTGGTAIPTGGNSNGTYYLGAATYANSNMKFNYGGYTTISISSAASDANGYGNFEYAPPSGYYALCGKNLAEYGGTA